MKSKGQFHFLVCGSFNMGCGFHLSSRHNHPQWHIDLDRAISVDVRSRSLTTPQGGPTFKRFRRNPHNKAPKENDELNTFVAHFVFVADNNHFGVSSICSKYDNLFVSETFAT